MRLTEKYMKEHFKHVFGILKLPTSSRRNRKGPDYYQRSFYVLECSPEYGGYRISLVGKETAHYTVFTAGRMKAIEMKRFLDGLAYAQRIKKEYR